MDRFKKTDNKQNENSDPPNVIVFVYAIDNFESFKQLRQLIETASELCADETLKVLVGNKCDITYDRRVDEESGAKLAEQFGCLFFETSCLKRHSETIDRLFKGITEHLIAEIERKTFKSDLYR